MSDEQSKMMADCFGYLFLISQRFEYITDSMLKKDNLTTKQLLVLIAIGAAFDHTPSISEVAEVLSTSHQNIKKIALQLQKRKLINIVEDTKDRRRKLLMATDENKEFWKGRTQEHADNLRLLFAALNKQDIIDFHRILLKLIDGSDTLYREARGK